MSQTQISQSATVHRSSSQTLDWNLKRLKNGLFWNVLEYYWWIDDQLRREYSRSKTTTKVQKEPKTIEHSESWLSMCQPQLWTFADTMNHRMWWQAWQIGTSCESRASFKSQLQFKGEFDESDSSAGSVSQIQLPVKWARLRFNAIQMSHMQYQSWKPVLSTKS